MSRSIKQYKDAMDSVRVSESFYARTEELLKENASSERITSVRPSYSRKCIGLVLGAAACAVIVTAVGKDRVTDDVTATGTVEETVTETATASETIYIDIEEDHVIYTISPAAEPDVAEAPKAGADADTAGTVTVPVSDNVAVNASETVVSEPEETVEEAAAEPEPDVMALYDIDFSSSETELKSYLNSGMSAESGGEFTEEGVYIEEAAPSGLNFIVLDEKAAEKTVTAIADAVCAAPVIEGREVVHTEFVIDVVDPAADKTAFTINICFDKTIQVIVYGQDKSYSAFYAVADPDFIEIEKNLFLKFGSAAQYEEFING